jgi:phosphoribosyl-AMP cyclohydrolase
MLPCRVMGGFSSNEKVYDWLDKGASKVVVDYVASNIGFLDGIPKERLCIALPLPVPNGGSVKDALEEIAYYAKSVLLQPATIDRAAIGEAKSLAEKGTMLAVQDPGTLTADDIAFLDALGIETVLGASLVGGALSLPDAMCAVLVSDRPDGLFPTVVVDEDNAALGLCYSNTESISEALTRQVGVYWSRTRGLWVKGLTSGSTQELLRVELDCDRDALRFVVRQSGTGFCHMDQLSCFGEDHGSLGALMRLLIDRKDNAPPGSYTKRLFDDPALLKSPPPPRPPRATPTTATCAAPAPARPERGALRAGPSCSRNARSCSRQTTRARCCGSLLSLLRVSPRRFCDGCR